MEMSTVANKISGVIQILDLIIIMVSRNLDLEVNVKAADKIILNIKPAIARCSEQGSKVIKVIDVHPKQTESNQQF